MTKLFVQLDGVAALREIKRGREPDPLQATFMAESGGAHGISLHLREDRKFVQDRDLRLIKEVVKTEFNVEMPPTQDMLKVALDLKPTSVTLVEPSKEEGIPGGLDVTLNQEKVHKYLLLLKEAHIDVYVRVDPELEQVRNAHRAGALHVEISTLKFAQAPTERSRLQELEAVRDAAKVAARLKMYVVLTGGLNYHHTDYFGQIDGVYAIKVGHSIVSRSLAVGFERAVFEMQQRLPAGTRQTLS